MAGQYLSYTEIHFCSGCKGGARLTRGDSSLFSFQNAVTFYALAEEAGLHLTLSWQILTEQRGSAASGDNPP